MYAEIGGLANAVEGFDQGLIVNDTAEGQDRKNNADDGNNVDRRVFHGADGKVGDDTAGVEDVESDVNLHAQQQNDLYEAETQLQPPAFEKEDIDQRQQRGEYPQNPHLYGFDHRNIRSVGAVNSPDGDFELFVPPDKGGDGEEAEQQHADESQ